MFSPDNIEMHVSVKHIQYHLYYKVQIVCLFVRVSLGSAQTDPHTQDQCQQGNIYEHVYMATPLSVFKIKLKMILLQEKIMELDQQTHIYLESVSPGE